MKLLLIVVMSCMVYAQEQLIIFVEGMHCPLCTTAVKKALKNVEGVEAVKVTLETKQAVVTAKEGISDAAYLDAVKTTGYEGVIRSRKAH